MVTKICLIKERIAFALDDKWYDEKSSPDEGIEGKFVLQRILRMYSCENTSKNI